MKDDEDPILFCIPIFNDWETARLLLTNLDRVLHARQMRARVMFVDDGSIDPPLHTREATSDALSVVEILTLRRNVGHQRAIALGLTFAYIERRFDAVVVMDGDGEDAPADAVKIIEHWNATGRRNVVVFARRARRSESLFFRAFYQAFKLMHVLLTGKYVEVGNFSLVPRQALARLVVSAEIWNHYSAGVFKSRILTDQISIPRARRLAGQSSMNFSALVVHGLSAISVYGETVAVRVATGLTILIIAGAVVLIAALAARQAWGVDLSSITIIGGALVLCCMVTALCVTLGCAFLVLHGRRSAAFLPARDYKHYIVRCDEVGTSVLGTSVMSASSESARADA